MYMIQIHMNYELTEFHQVIGTGIHKKNNNYTLDKCNKINYNPHATKAFYHIL
jgi:hypothetical protein